MFDSVEDCLEALRRGEIVLVTDDADRENEGDCICAAEFATRENVNFMATYGNGGGTRKRQRVAVAFDCKLADRDVRADRKGRVLRQLQRIVGGRQV